MHYFCLRMTISPIASSLDMSQCFRPDPTSSAIWAVLPPSPCFFSSHSANSYDYLYSPPTPPSLFCLVLQSPSLSPPIFRTNWEILLWRWTVVFPVHRCVRDAIARYWCFEMTVCEGSPSNLSLFWHGHGTPPKTILNGHAGFPWREHPLHRHTWAVLSGIPGWVHRWCVD